MAFFFDEPVATDVVSLQLDVATEGVVDAVVTGALIDAGAPDPPPENKFLKKPVTALPLSDAAETGAGLSIGIAESTGADDDGAFVEATATGAAAGIGAGITTGSTAAVTAGAERGWSAIRAPAAAA